MLKLKNIQKEYPAGNGKVAALKGIDLQFRTAEFVAILGPSGCGKTTTLNIIGGLDQYTRGDLIINGKSTKDFKDRDWDAYRNHSVGFVFQSYHLIPHQSVLANVELSLSLSGISRGQRRRRAKEALEKVGLGDQLRKKPGEMSGGQMQRVAIARAIVSDPDIILADEPTGALDTQTSLQVMEILKEISKDRLVIMVTHNPDLAEQYATRTVRMLDGRIVSDSNPLTPEESNALEEKEKADKQTKLRLPSLSAATSFGLSLRNLFTKKGRTILTSFAGSIGIIGIALIYAVSQGMTTYINVVQEETLASYPLTLEATHMDMSSLLETFMGQTEQASAHENDGVYQKSMIYTMMNALNSVEETKNDLKAFKTYLQEQRKPGSDTPFATAVSGVRYGYDLDLTVYTKAPDGSIIQSDTRTLLWEILSDNFSKNNSVTNQDASQNTAMGSLSSLPTIQSTGMWQELLPGEGETLINPILDKQYELVAGQWPVNERQVVLVLDKNNELDDMTLYALGLKSGEEIQKIVTAALAKEELKPEDKHWTYEEVLNRRFRVGLPGTAYVLDEKTGGFTDLRTTDAGLSYFYDNGLELEISGIIRPREDALAPMLQGSIGYTSRLSAYIIETSADSPVVKAQKQDPLTDVFNRLPFDTNKGNMTTKEKAEAFKAYLELLDGAGKKTAYGKLASIPPKEQVDQAVEESLKNLDRAMMEEQLAAAMITKTGMKEEDVYSYLRDMKEEDMTALVARGVEEQFKAQYAQQVAQTLATMGEDVAATALEQAVGIATEEELATYYEQVPSFSNGSYEKNLARLGALDLDSPSAIHLYAASFEEKENLKQAIQTYNDSVSEFEKIVYTDYVGLMMSSVTTIIQAITYVLIAFVAVSLVVSSIMIGVITLISVQERTKEIGILRAMGASKKNVSGMFNAETVMIGFAAGVMGVGITYLLCIPINAILHKLTGIQNLNAYLPERVALILVGISMLLTLISGIIPSRSAAKKDPVVALRTE